MSRRTLAFLLVALMAILGTAQAATTPNAATTTKVGALDQARIDAAKKAYTIYEAQYAAGVATSDALFTWSRNWYQAEHDAGLKSAGADYLARATKIQALVSKRIATGTATQADAAAADYYVAEAQLWK